MLQKNFFCIIKDDVNAPVAQLDRASDYGSEGCEFESRRARQLKKAPRGVFFVAKLGVDENSQRVRNWSNRRRKSAAEEIGAANPAGRAN